MKKVQAIIRPDFLEDLEERISESDIGGMTVSAVHGCGKQNGWKEYYRGTEIAMNMQPKLCCEFVVEDSLVEEAIALIVEVCRTGEVGDGKIFVTPVEQVVRIRTGERDSAAL